MCAYRHFSFIHIHFIVLFVYVIINVEFFIFLFSSNHSVFSLSVFFFWKCAPFCFICLFVLHFFSYQLYSDFDGNWSTKRLIENSMEFAALLTIYADKHSSYTQIIIDIRISPCVSSFFIDARPFVILPPNRNSIVLFSIFFFVFENISVYILSINRHSPPISSGKWLSRLSLSPFR